MVQEKSESMHIRGTHTEEINVEISAYELFKALAEALGIEEYYKTHYVLEKENNEFILRRYEDTSYHGFPSYECVDEFDILPQLK